MSFCTFSKDYSKSTETFVSNVFITDYLADASGDAVKVYLYGLFACNNSAENFDIEAFSKALYLSSEIVCDCFKFLEECGLVSIISEEPFTVKFLSLSVNSKPRKFKPEKYTEFNKAVQSLIPDRMISTSEYSQYFSIMEDYSIKPEAMLMIIKYCVDLKGSNIGSRYILTVCHNFCERNLTTTDAIEEELSEYISRTCEIQQILSTLNLKRKPEIEDLKLFNKWHNEMQFELAPIIFAAKKTKIKSMDKLDALVSELFNNKAFSEKEIENYLSEKNIIKDTAIKVASSLSVYCEVITPYIENFISPWMSKGYDADTLIKIANYCFKTKRKSFEDMNDMIDNFYSKGLVTLESITDYLTNLSLTDKFVAELLKTACAERRPNKWDRESVERWRNWGFSDEMLIESAKLASGKSNPMAYINIVLSNWKTQNIFTLDKIPTSSTAPTANQNDNNSFKAPKFGNERKYTKEDFDNFFDNLDEVDF